MRHIQKLMTFFILLLVVGLLFGCQRGTQQPQTAPTPSTGGSDGLAEGNQEIDEALGDLETIEDDLDVSDLDTIDQDLDF